MIEKQFPSESLLIHSLRTYYGIEVATFTLLPWGADRNALLYKAETSDKTSYFVKLKRGPRHGSVIVDLLHEAGIQQVIPPIKTIKGRSTQRMEDFTLIVYPFIQGQDGFSRALTDSQWITLGQALRQVHEITGPASIQNSIRREDYSPKWRETVRSLYILMAAEGAGDVAALQLLQFMKKNRAAIYRLVDRAEQLALKLQDQSPKFVLCHSDIHGGNVLIDQNDTIYIVDWDHPIMAPKERDLMFIGGGVANVWNHPHEEKLFYQGYGKTEIDLTILAYYRHERIVEDIAIYGQGLLLHSSGDEDRLRMYKQFIEMFEPSGVVDIAFKTDESLV